ncbi:hypothetical protein BJ944DRAFT_41558 [Cunninghamella echinulata]|nr:hypothetical protein BJ944DRAFT_41558 [Cunninghamella echinulata]
MEYYPLQHNRQQQKMERLDVQGLLNIIFINHHNDYQQRIDYAKDLERFIIEARTNGNIRWYRQDMMQIVETCIYTQQQRLIQVISYEETDKEIKKALISIVSNSACYTRLDILIGWVLEQFSQQSSKRFISWLFELLLETIKNAQVDSFTHRQLQELSPSIMSTLVLFLDTVNAMEYLNELLDNLNSLAKYHSNSFINQFQDIIDILVGWYLDPSISDSDREIIANSFKKYEPFWKSKYSFGFELLQHFLTDIYQRIQQKEEYDILHLLLGCFDSLLQSISPLIFDLNKNELQYQIILTAFDQLRSNTLSLFIDVLENHQNSFKNYQKWLLRANSIFFFMIQAHPISFQPLQYSFFNYITTQNQCNYISAEIYITYLLKLVTISPPTDQFKKLLLDVNTSPLYTLITENHNSNINKGIFLLLQYILQTTSQPLLNDISHQWLTLIQPYEIKTTIPIMNKITNKTKFKTYSFDEPTFNALDEDQLKLEWAKYNYLVWTKWKALEIDHQYKYLTEIGKEEEEGGDKMKKRCASDIMESKASVIIRLDPLVYCQLLLSYLITPSSIPMEMKQRHVYRITYLMHSSWQKGEFQLFQHMLDILINAWTTSSSILNLENDIIQSSVLNDLIDCWLQLNLRAKNTILKYFNSLILSTTLLNNDETPYFSNLLLKLLKIEEYEKNGQIKEKIVKLVRNYCQLFGSSKEIDFILHHIKKLAASNYTSVKETSKAILCELNPFMISEADDYPDELITTLKTLIMATPHTGMFRPVHYEIVMKQLGLEEHLVNSNCTNDNEKKEHSQFNHHNDNDVNNAIDSLDWAKRILNYCDGVNQLIKLNNKKVDDSFIESVMNGSTSLLYYWSIWEISRYCILSRLRTPFGGPQQTFAAFEKALQSFINTKDPTIQQQLSYRRSLSMILLLLDRLEIQIYHAFTSDPSASSTNALPTVPKPSFTFFSTNRKTCQDYFTRIRPLIIQSAKVVHLDTLTLKHTISYLSFAKTQLNTIASLDILVNWYKSLNVYIKDMAELCIRQKLVDSLVGLEFWYQHLLNDIPKHIMEEFEKNYYFIGWIGPLSKNKDINESADITSWFQIAAKFAMGHDEEAIKLLSQYPPTINDSYGILEMLHSQVINFYTSLEDYTSIQSVCERYPNLFSTEITNELANFTISNKQRNSHSNGNKLMDFITSSPLDKCVQLGRLTQFRRCIMDKKNDDKFTSVLKDRLLRSVVEDSIVSDGYYNKTHLVELQITHQQPFELQRSAEDWLITIKKRELNPWCSIPDTNHWVRLANLSTDKFPMIQLQAAKVAKRQCNYETATHFLDICQSHHITKDLSTLEKIRLKIDQHELMDAIVDLNQFIISNEKKGSNNDKKEDRLIIDFYLTLAQLLQKKLDYNGLFDDTLGLSFMNEYSYGDNIIDKTFGDSSLFYIQRSIETVLKKSIEESSAWSKPWYSYANYHYQQASYICDEKAITADLNNHTVTNTTNVSLTNTNNTVEVLIKDKAIMLWLDRKFKQILENYCIDLPEDLYQQVKSRFLHLFKKRFVDICNQSDQFSTSSIVLSDIQQDDVLKINLFHKAAYMECLKVMDILQLNKIEHLKKATTGYFQYLQFVGENENTNNQQQDRRLYHHNSNNSQTILSALRLLQILVNYGDALQPTFNEYINNNNKTGSVVMMAWKHVTPQLFARLNHPSNFVRSVINHWITQLVDTFPDDIVYDVMVGSTSTKTNQETKQILQQQANRMMQYGKDDLWISTRRMAEEFEKITVLWEEQWLHHLASLQFEVMTQYEQLDKELASANTVSDNNSSEFVEIYTSTMKYIIGSVEKLINNTIDSSIIMTPHEQWFNTTYGKLIRQAFDLLVNPESKSTYRKGWDRFQQIHRRLAMETQKLRIFDLDRISPYLAKWQKTSTKAVIRMPGLSGQQVDQNNPHFINHFGSTVVVLPTKTKPKKLDVYSTDGTTYTYLLKGLEDLHLDERIIQLLNTINITLKEDPEASIRGLKARTYAVIPMSDHSGMIQWVNNATPLFSFYKNWQRLHHNGKRPTEIYVEKVLGALKQAGLRVTANRRHWPSHILNQVYSEMIKETPQDLLEKFIWYTSCNSGHWLNKSRSLTRSMAVMSMVGYVIGLGDRHLDNILMDDTIGDIIHIDYNVCFEKGTSLRVPERVPFRLTQNLIYAMELHNYNGLFKISAEHTLRIMRQHKDLLIGLLDAFVYDPLVDWREQNILHHHENHENHWIELQANLNKVAKTLSDTTTSRENQYKDMMNQLIFIKQELQDKQQHYQQIALDNSEEEDEEYGEVYEDEEEEEGEEGNEVIKQAEVEGEDIDDNEKKKVMMDRLREGHDNKAMHQQSLFNILKTCQHWELKHKEALDYLIRDQPMLKNLIKQHYLTADTMIPFENNLETKITSWMCKRDTVDQLIAQDFNVYYQLAHPVYLKLKQQDTCSIYHGLLASLIQSTNTINTTTATSTTNNNSNNNINNNSAGGNINNTGTSNSSSNIVSSTAVSNPNINASQHSSSRNVSNQNNNGNSNNANAGVSIATEGSAVSAFINFPNQLETIQMELNRDLSDDISIIQQMSTTIYQFVNQLNQYIDFVKKEIQNNQRGSLDNTHISSNMDKMVLVDHIKHDINQLLNYKQHQMKAEFKLITNTEQELERKSYLGLNLKEESNFGWLTITQYFNHLELDNTIESKDDILEASKWISKSSIALYRFEYNCWQFCKKIYDSLFESQKLVEEMSFYLDITDHSAMINPEFDEHHKKSKPKLWNKIQEIFLPMDMLYISSKKMGHNPSNDVYSTLKKELITKLLKETIKRFNMMPSDVWMSSLLLSWSLTTSISNFTRKFINLFLYDIQLPLCISILTSLTPQLRDGPPEKIYIGNSSAYLIKLNETILQDCETQLKQYQIDYHRFQWFNISYLNSNQDSINQVASTMMARVEQISNIISDLHSLNDFILKISSTDESYWEPLYQQELEKYTFLGSLCSVIVHLENTRKGCQQGIQMEKEIQHHLQSLYSNTNTAGRGGGNSSSLSLSRLDSAISSSMATVTGIKDQQQHGKKKMNSIPSQLFNTIKQKIKQIFSPLEEYYKSPNFISLLESIMMMEIEQNNEMHVAQQSAKVISDTMNYISTCQEKLDYESTFTLYELIDMIQEAMNILQQFYSSLRVLETFGIDPIQPIDEKPVIKNVQQQKNAHVMKIIQRVQEKLDGYDFGIDHAMDITEQVSITINQATSAKNLSLMYEGWTSWV